MECPRARFVIPALELFLEDPHVQIDVAARIRIKCPVIIFTPCEILPGLSLRARGAAQKERLFQRLRRIQRREMISAPLNPNSSGIVICILSRRYLNSPCKLVREHHESPLETAALNRSIDCALLRAQRQFVYNVRNARAEILLQRYMIKRSFVHDISNSFVIPLSFDIQTIPREFGITD